MKVISFDKIQNAGIKPLQCYEWVSESIKNKNQMILPAKISLKPGQPGVYYNTMPAIVPTYNIGGLKFVTRYPNSVPSLDSQIVLCDLQTGEHLALLDGNWITAMRTGAVVAHSVKTLAKESFSVMGFMGLGNTATASLLVIAALFPEKHLVIKLKKYKDQHQRFVGRFSSYKNMEFIYEESYEAVVRGSDVVISAVTMFEEDICSDDCFDEGVLVVPVHTRGFTNCDLFFDKVFADDRAHVHDFKNFDRFRDFAEMSEVVNGIHPGRTEDRERILAYNIGIAIHDLVFAKKLYELLGSECADITLNAPTDKFWI